LLAVLFVENVRPSTAQVFENEMEEKRAPHSNQVAKFKFIIPDTASERARWWMIFLNL
jgi:hypothetical protein